MKLRMRRKLFYVIILYIFYLYTNQYNYTVFFFLIFISTSVIAGQFYFAWFIKNEGLKCARTTNLIKNKYFMKRYTFDGILQFLCNIFDNHMFLAAIKRASFKKKKKRDAPASMMNSLFIFIYSLSECKRWYFFLM